MDDYDYQGEWDAFDTQDFGSLGDTTAYQGMGNDYGYGQSYQPAEQMQQPWENPNYTMGSDGTQFWRDQAGMDVGYMPKGGEFTPYQGMQQQNMQQPGMDWAGMGKGTLDALGSLFKGGSGGSTSSFLKGLAGLYAAGQEKKSNQYMANQIPQQVNSMRQFAAPYDVASTGAGMMTPGATTMRDAAMQQAALANQRLQNFRADPNSTEVL